MKWHEEDWYGGPHPDPPETVEDLDLSEDEEAKMWLFVDHFMAAIANISRIPLQGSHGMERFRYGVMIASAYASSKAGLPKDAGWNMTMGIMGAMADVLHQGTEIAPKYLALMTGLDELSRLADRRPPMDGWHRGVRYRVTRIV